eukprot:Phypoly_transcript_08294.p1 GENE.Phypoly_transcript_08294~~Phypoly_transcript_08294.p1  ORF type:complete len:343 (+),score=30.87 Phypoly_transcript_08294:497-1525(+)
MECSHCKIRKLSNEFPKKRLALTCKHCPSWCLQCLVSENERNCPECTEPYDSGVFEDLCYHLNLVTQADFLKPPPPRTTTIATRAFRTVPQQITFNVLLLGGESKSCTASTTTTVVELMEHIHRVFGVASNEQRLMFDGQQLKRYIEGEQAQLRDYNVTNGSSLQLMKLLLSVTQETPYRTVVFNLTYGRGNRMKFLDASCLVYRGQTLYQIVDFRNTYGTTGVVHSGPAHGAGRHTVQVNLPSIHNAITHLFFVMSACHVATLREFEAPTVSVYDTARPHTQISSFSFRAQGTSQAVIMCCLKRTEAGWDAFHLAEATEGYCYNYHPIQYTIQRLFASRIL